MPILKLFNKKKYKLNTCHLKKKEQLNNILKVTKNNITKHQQATKYKRYFISM